MSWLYWGIPCQVILYALWYSWWGGWCFGPRFLTDALPLLILLLVPTWNWFRGRPFWKVVFILTAIYSFAVQCAGSLWYPRGKPDSYPQPIDRDNRLFQGRLWSWRDSQLSRIVREGITVPRPITDFKEELWFEESPQSLPAGDTAVLAIGARNLGKQAWSATNDRTIRYAVQVSYHWRRESEHRFVVWDGIRSWLPVNVYPGEVVRFDTEIITPEEPGSYVLVLDLVQQGVGWFQEHGGQVLKIPVWVAPKKGCLRLEG